MFSLNVYIVEDTSKNTIFPFSNLIYFSLQIILSAQVDEKVVIEEFNMNFSHYFYFNDSIWN